MRMQIEVTLDYQLQAPSPAMLCIEAATTGGQMIEDARISFGASDHVARVAADEGVGERVLLRAGTRLQCRYSGHVAVTRPAPDLPALDAVAYEALPGDALRYTLPSRFCEAERFAPFVRRRFGDLSGGALVAAIRDWVQGHLDYVPGASGPETTAADSFLDRQGVCRDYAHLMIAMCRAAQIPARYASVYSPRVDPPDFHAVVQLFLSGGWHLVDPTGMATADQMALIAVGRDATDVAFLSTISFASLNSQNVLVTDIAA